MRPTAREDQDETSQGGRRSRGSHALGACSRSAVSGRVPLGVTGASGEEMTRDQQMTGEVAKKLVGAWRYVGTTIDGVNKPRGNNPKGIIYYGPHGEMSVQIAPDVERKRAGAAMTDY